MLGADGQKALAPSGVTIVGQEFVRDPVALGQVAHSLLDVLPTKQHTSAEYVYLRQSVRTNNAAIVAEGAAKPTSVYSVVRVENSLQVIAHLSEGIPRYWLLDNQALERSRGQRAAVRSGLAVEAKVLADINATSGIQTHSYTTSGLATLRPDQAGDRWLRRPACWGYTLWTGKTWSWRGPPANAALEHLSLPKPRGQCPRWVPVW